jgi:hypothetical protein
VRLALLLAASLTLPALAAGHDAAYYQRTGTKPPAQGEFVMWPSLHTGNRTIGQVSIGLLVPLRSYAKAAKK